MAIPKPIFMLQLVYFVAEAAPTCYAGHLGVADLENEAAARIESCPNKAHSQ